MYRGVSIVDCIKIIDADIREGGVMKDIPVDNKAEILEDGAI